MYGDLSKTDKEKDIGVVIDKKLSFLDHLIEVNKVNGIVRLIRTFQQLNPKMFVSIYRPHLEYTIQAWYPHLVKDIETI